ncbi:MAG TPA: response regulator transcription factor [Verrucomicrobiota bacterium]|nr:response regulator transcription factor [Verrucomicrobiota bacterium]
MSRPRVLLADDHVLLIEALRKLLEPAFEVVAVVTDGRALVETALRLRPDVVVADIGMPRLNGLDAAEQLGTRLPGARIVVLTVNEDPEIAAEAIRRGAQGYVLKKSAATELFTAIRAVLEGRHYVTPLITRDPTMSFVTRARRSQRAIDLTPRQREVLQLLAEGRSMKEAADILKVTPRTIAFHKYTMMEQHGLKTGAELVQYAVRLGLVTGLGPSTPTCQF